MENYADYFVVCRKAYWYVNWYVVNQKKVIINVKLPGKWMIATDGSKYADLSVKYAANLFVLMPEKPEVWIVNVVSDPMGTGSEGLKKEISQAEQMLTNASFLFSEEGAKNKNIHILVEIGDPRRTLAGLLKKLEIEHLFMGGADFSFSAVNITTGGITNYMLHHLKGTVTIIK